MRSPDPPGHRPGVGRGRTPRATRLDTVWHRSRRHVDYCRTATALCRG